MFADIGNIVGLLIFAVIAILSAVLKKKEKDEEETFELPPELKPRRDRNQPPPARNWEEELRKLLEDRSPPPPVVRHVPAPTHPTAAPPVIEEGARAWEEPHTEGHSILTQPRYEPEFAAPAALTESEVRFSEAAHLQERVAHHMADVTHHRVGTTSVQRTKVSADIQEVREMVQTRRGARAAIIASIILGPPRALEP